MCVCARACAHPCVGMRVCESSRVWEFARVGEREECVYGLGGREKSACVGTREWACVCGRARVWGREKSECAGVRVWACVCGRVRVCECARALCVCVVCM